MKPAPSLLLSAALLAAPLLSGCGREEGAVRRYTEVVLMPEPRAALPANHPPMASAAPGPVAAPAPMGGAPAMTGDVPTGPGLHLAWTVPPGWTEGSGPSIRIATLLVDGAECSIVAFPGDTGGVEANLRRWLGQLDAPPPPAGAWGTFLGAPARVQTEGGWPCSVFDFEAILPASAERSILAGLLTVDGQSVFVKLMGPRAVLAAQKAAFERLCASLRKKSDV